LKGYPLGLLYFVKTGTKTRPKTDDDDEESLAKSGIRVVVDNNGNETVEEDLYEVLDGQQRITSFARFVNGTDEFKVEMDGRPLYFDTLNPDEQELVKNTSLTIYVCEGTASEIQEWFEKINIVGVPLNSQELLNASFHGSFVNEARKIFSNANNANMKKWGKFVTGDPKRQEILKVALEWAAHKNDTDKVQGDVKDYMSKHRFDTDITDMKNHFDTVINWAATTFKTTYKQMKGLDWGRLYRLYGKTYTNSPDVTDKKVEKYMSDPFVTDKKGIFEYILNGEKDDESKKLLNIRIFTDTQKATVYAQQTADAKAKGISNCPLCAIGHGANATKIWDSDQMEADHVSAWSKGNPTDIANCQMLCDIHNKAKGNR